MTAAASPWHARLDRLAYLVALALAFALPWERSLQIPGVGALGRLIGIVALAAAVASLLDRDGIRLRRLPLFLVVGAALTLWAFASVFWSINPPASFGRAFTYAQLVLMAWVFWQTARTPARIRGLLQGYVAGCYVMVGALVLAFLAGASDGLVRYTALDENQNYLAQTLVLGLPMAWYLTVSGSQRVFRWLNPLFLPACLFVLGLTASRGGLVMAVVALSVVPLTLGALPPLRRTLVLLFVVLGIGAALLLVPDANLARLAETSDRIAEGDFTSRERIWQAGLRVFLDPAGSWAFGTGSGSYPDAVASAFGYGMASHNAFMSLLVELGLVGFLLFAALLALPVLPTPTLPPLERWTYLALWGALVVAMLSSNWDYHRATWLTLTLLAARRGLVVGPARRRAPHRTLELEAP
jgi:O-antigen ligase